MSRRALAPRLWLEDMLARKPRMLVIVALANKMVRTALALVAKMAFTEIPQSSPERYHGVKLSKE